VKPVGSGSTAEQYLEFAEESLDSPCFRAWGREVAADADVLAFLDALPRPKRQPNLLFAAARWHGAQAPGPYEGLRRVLLDRADDVRATMLARATQTNEVGRCATLLPVLASLPQPLALIEVGASAGLTLHPDRCSYVFETPDGSLRVDPSDGTSPVVLPCRVEGPAPVPQRVPEVAWRAGIDLNPLDVADADAMAWLETLVWPEHEDRRDRLRAAVALTRADPPRLVRGDLLEELPRLLDEVPGGATPVVFHSAVLAYLPDDARHRFVSMVRELPVRWVSNEGPAVLPGVEPRGAVVPGDFLLALDGHQVAWAQGHGRALRWLPTHG
jgi:hypothetical protein